METLVQQAIIDSAIPAPARVEQEYTARIKTAHGHAKVVHSASHIRHEVWQKAFSWHCMDHRYYEVVERTITQDFDYRYFILTNEQTGRVCVQPFFFVKQDITAGLPNRFRAAITKVRERFPRFLSMRIMMVGCAAGEGHLDCHEPWAVEALQEAVNAYARMAKASIILFKDFPSIYRSHLSGLKEKGFTRVPSMPGAQVDLAGFVDFDDYMAKKLSHSYRKNLRRKFRDAERLGNPKMEVVTDIAPYVDEIHPLYLQTHNRSEFKFEVLTKEYFVQLSQRMGDRVKYFLWRLDGRIIAFSICMCHDGVLHDLNVGMDYSVALDLHMYFVTWRDIVSWAIEQKITTYYTGPLNYDPKFHLKLDLAPLDLYARHRISLINPIFGFAMKYLQPVRHDPVISKFANAHEL